MGDVDVDALIAVRTPTGQVAPLGDFERDELASGLDEIVAVLGFAGGSDQPVRILTTNKMEVVGVPTSVDAHIEAHEVYLLPPGADETEIAVNLGAIESVELM